MSIGCAVLGVSRVIDFLDIFMSLETTH
jgi:hypothetical protein